SSDLAAPDQSPRVRRGHAGRRSGRRRTRLGAGRQAGAQDRVKGSARPELGRCRRDRRRLRRPDGGAHALAGGTPGGRAGGARPGRRPGLEPRPRRWARLRAGRHVRGADPGSRDGARPRAGVGTFPVYDRGNDLYVADGTRLTYSGRSPFGTAPPDPMIAGDLATIVLEIDQMSKSVPVAAPWTAVNAAAWDGQTLESFINAHDVTPRFNQLVAAATRAIFGAEPRELSLLFTLF